MRFRSECLDLIVEFEVHKWVGNLKVCHKEDCESTKKPVPNRVKMVVNIFAAGEWMTGQEKCGIKGSK